MTSPRGSVSTSYIAASGRRCAFSDSGAFVGLIAPRLDGRGNAGFEYFYRCAGSGCANTVRLPRRFCAEHTTEEQLVAVCIASAFYRLAVLSNRWRGEFSAEGARA